MHRIALQFEFIEILFWAKWSVRLLISTDSDLTWRWPLAALPSANIRDHDGTYLAGLGWACRSRPTAVGHHTISVSAGRI